MAEWGWGPSWLSVEDQVAVMAGELVASALERWVLDSQGQCLAKALAGRARGGAQEYWGEVGRLGPGTGRRRRLGT